MTGSERSGVRGTTGSPHSKPGGPWQPQGRAKAWGPFRARNRRPSPALRAPSPGGRGLTTMTLSPRERVAEGRVRGRFARRKQPGNRDRGVSDTESPTLTRPAGTLSRGERVDYDDPLPAGEGGRRPGEGSFRQEETASQSQVGASTCRLQPVRIGTFVRERGRDERIATHYIPFVSRSRDVTRTTL